MERPEADRLTFVIHDNRKRSGEIRSELLRYDFPAPADEGEEPRGQIIYDSNEAAVALGMQLIIDGVNGADTRKAAEWLAETFMSEHRTLQQDTIRMFQMAFAYIEQQDEKHSRHDLRNEGAMQQVRNWNEAKREYLPLI